ncbi:MAG TPA: ATP-binding protein [Microbacterium sp.]|uniref:sensor histidine kinase n=1 Tax=Microbacterium sp. TaxID=51671 RepID=UPI002C8F0A5E|nr:ATP-binding protein [Microbacterium sp.]HWI32369.1 ATP-binding protein [Microbacterium sp.]
MTEARAARGRPAWTLQTRLMVTVIGIVSVILVIVAVATSAILGQVLETRLSEQLRSTMDRVKIAGGPGGAFEGPDVNAKTILESSPQQAGFLLIVKPFLTPASGAFVADDLTVTALTDEQLQALADGLDGPGPTTVEIDGVGSYVVLADAIDNTVAVVGLARTEVQQTIARMLTTIGLLTAGGLLVLAAATAFVIRVGLRPLRSVADTATRVASVPMDQGAVSISARVPADQADDRTEIGQVGAALNTLLDHVDASLDARQRNEERMRRFVADASHELRTPLASIRGYSELSLRALRRAEGPVFEGSESALERIQAQSIRMTRLVEDLLLLARLDEGQDLVYGSVDLTQLALEAVGDARPAGPDHSWRVEVSDEPVVLAGDAARLHQVVANLLANARIHTPAGTEVTVRVFRDGADAVLTVHDDGPGVDPAVQADLFERFARGDRSRARQTGGTGLGLSIAKAIVTAHHGTIEVDSAPGDTTFTLRLPARPHAPVVP